MGETIAVLFVFFILIAVGFIFYGRVIKGDIETQKDESSQLKSIGVAQKLMFLPELECSENNIVKEHCIDILKLEFSQQIMAANQIYYYDLFGFTSVNISQIYPEKKSWMVYSRMPQGYKNKYVTHVPVSVYDPAKKTYGFGIIAIFLISKLLPKSFLILCSFCSIV